MLQRTEIPCEAIYPLLLLRLTQQRFGARPAATNCLFQRDTLFLRITCNEGIKEVADHANHRGERINVVARIAGVFAEDSKPFEPRRPETLDQLNIALNLELLFHGGKIGQCSFRRVVRHLAQVGGLSRYGPAERRDVIARFDCRAPEASFQFNESASHGPGSEPHTSKGAV